jgi:ribose transport system permease protein
MNTTEISKNEVKMGLINSKVIEKFAAFAALILLVALFSIMSPAFRTVDNLLTVALQTSIIAFIGIGVVFVIVAGGIDLGIGSVIALTGVAAGLAMQAGCPAFPAILLALLVGIICGLFNGFVITTMKLPPFIATLGTMMVARGFALYITNAAPITISDPFFNLLGGTIPGTRFPVPVVIMILIALIFGFILQKTRLGRYTYATGSNEEAARLSGINIQRTKITLFAISGLLAAVAGIVLASRLSTAQATAGVSYEMDAIASAAVGGASLTHGGVGTIMGTMIGAFIIGVLRNGLNMLGVSSFIQSIVIGGVLIIAVYMDQLRNKKA